MIPFEQFEEWALAAADELEAAFPGSLENVAICIEERPTPHTRTAVGLVHHETLLGLYEGVPQTERTHGEEWMLPDKITLYTEPILDEAEDEGREVKDVVREVMWHEVAHALGLDEDHARAAEVKCYRQD